MEILGSILRYWQFYRKAHTIYDVHSPYAAGLIKAYFGKINRLPPYIETIRKNLEKNQSPLGGEDHGAGSRIKIREKTVANTARRSLSTPDQLSRLYRLILFCRPQKILELGTSFGLSCLTMQAAAPTARIYSIEANASIAKLAKKNIKESKCFPTPEIISGTFEATLPSLVKEKATFDLVFIDGDHTYQATLKNLQEILPALNNDSLVLIHDIYWSDDMMSAWEACKALEPVRMSLDFFDLGILIFKKEILIKQHITILPYWLKFWRIGLFARS